MSRFKTDEAYSGRQGKHGYSVEETESAMNYCNHRLGRDPALRHVLPIKTADDLFSAVKDGILLCKLVNVAVPGTIDDRSINTGKTNHFQVVENQNLAINSARAIGCNLTNIGAQDLIAGTPHLVLGLMWQVIKIGLIQSISLKEHPELIHLLEDGESLDDLLGLPPEQILLRWVNYQMKQAGHPRRIHNFGRDINDSEVYTVLLNQVSKGRCSKSPLSTRDPSARAEKMLQEAAKIDCREFVAPRDVVAGNQKLNFCFVANVFNKFPALAAVESDQMEEVMEEIRVDDDEMTRDERAFKHWMESLGFTITDLYHDLANGMILLKLIDIIKPGTVDWRIVKKDPPRRRIMWCVGNCALAVKLARSEIGCSLVSIGGSDIANKNKKLTLAIVWQLMRAHYMKILQELGGGKRISDRDMIKWANSKCTTPQSVRHFRDRNLCTGEYCCYLVHAISAQSVNTAMISRGGTPEDYISNASYALSCARKIGALVFCVAEDIVELNSKMILAMFAALMKVDLQK